MEVKFMKKVDFLSENEKLIYNFSKNEALERLKAENVSESEQMLTKWCRDDEIDAVRVVKGAPKDRGLRINEKSLTAFILSKKGDVTSLLERIEELEKQLKEAKKEIKELKESGLKKPRKSTVKIINSFYVVATETLHFTMDRAKHEAKFNGDQLVKVERNTRTGLKDVTDQITEEIKEVLEIEKKKKQPK